MSIKRENLKEVNGVKVVKEGLEKLYRTVSRKMFSLQPTFHSPSFYFNYSVHLSSLHDLPYQVKGLLLDLFGPEFQWQILHEQNH